MANLLCNRRTQFSWRYDFAILWDEYERNER